jgi:predicted transcriptional regulator
MPQTRRAFSVHQPYAEQILRGTKKYEYRSIPTRIRGRVYIYATLKRHTTRPLTRGRIVGTVEVISCEWSPRRQCYRWKLASPRRIRPRTPQTHPQPVWFYPFT